MKPAAFIALTLVSLTSCREEPEAPARAPAKAAPSAGDIEEACGRFYFDQGEAMMNANVDPEPIDSLPRIVVRAASCTLVDGYTASCRYEIAWMPTTPVEISPDRLSWRGARGSFRFRGNRIATSRWYPAQPDACAAP